MTMRRIPVVVHRIFAVIFFTTYSLQAAETLAAAEARIDQAAAQFKGLTAKIKRVSYTAVIKDKTEESGTIAIKKVKAGDTRIKIDVLEPAPRSTTIGRRKYENFLPKIATVQEVDLGKYANLVDQFMLLGFGSTAKELEASYTLKVTGEEMINGKLTSRIELIPKSEKVLEHLKRVEMWIPLTTGYPVQQKFHKPSGDFEMSTYSEIQWNPTLSEADVTLKLPKNVKREYPLKD